MVHNMRLVKNEQIKCKGVKSLFDMWKSFGAINRIPPMQRFFSFKTLPIQVTYGKLTNKQLFK